MKKKNKSYLTLSFGLIITIIIAIVILDSGIIDSLKSEKELAEEIESNRKEKIRMLERNEENLSVDERLEMGLLYSNEEKYKEAEQIYLKVLEDDPENTLAIHRMGNLAIEKSDFNKALNYREKYVMISPNEAAGFFYYSLVLILTDISESLQMANKAFELGDSDDASFYDGYRKIIHKIVSGNVNGYLELVSNEDLFIPDKLKIAIIEEAISSHQLVPQELLEIQNELNKK